MLSQEKIDEVVDHVADYAKKSLGTFATIQVAENKPLPEKIKEKVEHKKDEIRKEDEARRKVMFKKMRTPEPVNANKKNKVDFKDVFQLLILLVPVVKLSKKILNDRKMK
ncbi:hypothetical protein ACVRZD_00620 [Streptococcus hongkongensis]